MAAIADAINDFANASDNSFFNLFPAATAAAIKAETIAAEMLRRRTAEVGE